MFFDFKLHAIMIVFIILYSMMKPWNLRILLTKNSLIRKCLIRDSELEELEELMGKEEIAKPIFESDRMD